MVSQGVETTPASVVRFLLRLARLLEAVASPLAEGPGLFKGPAMPTPTAEQLRAKDDRQVRDSLARTRQRIAAALSLPCPECAAPRGSYCTADAHGFCRYRFEKGLSLSVPAPLLTSPANPAVASAARESQTQPERRHPNRHPVRSAR